MNRHGNMDVIISANDEVKQMINHIPMSDDNKVSVSDFQEMIIKLSGGKKDDEV